MTINCKGNLIDLTVPKVMGILNRTPDSFFDGGQYTALPAALLQVEKMLQDGATFIDIGAYSSRPNATHISEEEELQRLTPLLEKLVVEFPEALFSVDTFRSTVADVCLHIGACMINDISGGNLDPNMFATIAQHQVPYCLMHMKGSPQTMQKETHYENLVQEVLYYFSQKVAAARSFGIHDIIIDPGFGFSKTLTHNYTLLSQLELLHWLELPVLVGVSRKSMVYKTLDTDAAGALNGTSVLHTYALGKGANILRVHDVKEAVECITLMEALKAENH